MKHNVTDDQHEIRGLFCSIIILLSRAVGKNTTVRRSEHKLLIQLLNHSVDGNANKHFSRQGEQREGMISHSPQHTETIVALHSECCV